MCSASVGKGGLDVLHQCVIEKAFCQMHVAFVRDFIILQMTGMIF